MPPPSALPARLAVAHVAGSASGGPLDRSLRVTLNFHPDRLVGGATVLERLSRDGRYRSQFETGTSNGGLTAHPGGARWGWEQRMFGHAYDDAPAAERPKYGALNHRRRRIGGALRFGSAQLRLTGAVLDRTTFCFPDSVFEPTAMATADRFGLFPLVERFAARPLTDEIEATDGGLLDDYVEAHVHGPIDLASDVEAVVLDPCFRGSPTEFQARALGLPLEWHEGRRLTVEKLARHPRFRGPRTVEVGRSIAVDGVLDAAVIGQAARAGQGDPQDLKRVWHCVARFGSPLEV
ncbi:DUF3626 domain-containing protein [Blastococcus goldschmidtiae]|uniref:DUF3626 domain-containing protein n=1 Tax=Blastococcus goldschmidtiae TaxID=3075546 RepID=A0ABU2K2K2_9ACTN|nr:DUF3626 domain-containing protein [Blastococcus sp. DSM 46792]MDT0274447.1 DUF3626 domain-containing protein [Blastococcus sp. DSM 46792]